MSPVPKRTPSAPAAPARPQDTPDGARIAWWRHPALPLGAVVGIAAVVAVVLHRNGHTQGDDFALYLRQARSIFDGDVGDVLADNRFTVTNSASGFSPFSYPWGWPLLLSPFVKLWGYDYDKLKLLEVAAFCTWLVLVHGVVRRRIGRPLALAVTAVVGTAPALLAHTDQLLSEYPHAASVGVFLWWLDRLRSRGRLVDRSTRELWILGSLVALTFQFRRETITFVAVIGAVQVVELVVGGWRAQRGRRSLDRLVDGVGGQVVDRWRQVITPHLATAACVIGFQLLLPSMLFPDNGNNRSFVDDRIGDYTGWLSRHLGLGWHPLIGGVVLVLMVVGMVVGVRRRPGLDGPLALVTLATMFAASTHFRMVDRYYFQVLPWVLYFATVAVLAAVGALVALATGGRGATRASARRAGTVATAITALPLVFVVAVHAAVLPGDMRDARKFDRDGRIQVGPTHPDFVPIYEAVKKYTRPTDVVAYFRARTMTLLTDRPTIQTGRIERIVSTADFFAQRRNSDYVQPEFTEAEGRALGLEVVWEDDTWVLWRIPAEVRERQAAEMFAAARGEAGPVVTGG